MDRNNDNKKREQELRKSLKELQNKNNALKKVLKYLEGFEKNDKQNN